MPQEQGHHNQAIWDHSIGENSMSANVEDDDFAKYLDLDTDFQFTGLDNGSSGLDTPMGRLGLDQNALRSLQGLGFGNEQSMSMDMSSSSHHGDYSATGTPATAHHFEPYQQQYHQMAMGHHYHVPPTPISSEMHAAKYGQRMDAGGHLVYDTHQVSFTPLVSPAQTPLTGTFSLPEYVLGEDFFSPLTSPAIEAQQSTAHLTGTTASPSDLNIDLTIPKASTASAKRGRRRGSVSGRPAARSIKHSPAMKPQTRRRQPSLSNLPIEKIEALMKQPISNQTRQSHLSNMGFHASDESVSPEALSESLMRPPPIPLNTDRSPRGPLPSYISESTNPVTPSTLMKMPSDQRIDVTAAEQGVSMTDMIGGQMEDIMLPDAATPSVVRPDLPTLDVSGFSGDDQSTPTLSARSAKASKANTPKSGNLKSSSQDSFSKPNKLENKGGRGSKKRQSTTSAAISPAIRPKISPSISPLAPATGMGHLTAESSTLFLASKSNYQNIIDGTHLPGVTYPEALAENLSSKRTSHKLAEQGRRNRINVALKEIESLLPPTIVSSTGKKERTKSEEAEDGEQGGSSAQSASKASTVEMAITYIKSLQAELEATKDKLRTAEQRLAETSSGSASQASEEAVLDKS